MKPISMRSQLRAFQSAHAGTPDPAFEADLALLRHKDLDLSIKLGALLAFDALLMTVGVNPVSASPGAPMSLDARSDPAIVIACLSGLAILMVAAMGCVRGILIGEDVGGEGLGEDPRAHVQRVFAAYAVAIDAQARLLTLSGWLTVLGGAVATCACLWAVLDKFF
jgi:hypothetical protein